MIIKSCLDCKFHEIRDDERYQSSYCRKESCWAVYTNCITQKAVERFLIEECETIDGSLHLNAVTR
jgi:hypothetical protein